MIDAENCTGRLRAAECPTDGWVPLRQGRDDATSQRDTQE
jgi:hypothetical protein